MSRIVDCYENERRHSDRRQKRASFVLHERRSGFDRRQISGPGKPRPLTCVVLALRDRPALLGSLLVIVNMLNLADFLFTLNVLRLGGGEANPIMAPLFALGPFWAGLFKLAAVLLVTLIIWQCRRFRRALEVSLLLTAIFAAIFCYQVWGFLVYC